MKRLVSCIFVFLLLLTLLSGCGKRAAGEYYDYHFFAMDTYITLRFSRLDKNGNALSADDLAKAASDCEQLLKKLESELSAHNESSPLWSLNRNVVSEITASRDLAAVLDAAFRITELTGGAYDPTLGALSELWNITGGGPVPSAKAIAECLTHTGTDKIIVDGDHIAKADPSVKLDFGGVGKGYAAEKLIGYLNDTDIAYGLISLGGNIGVFGSKASGERYKVGITDPNDPDCVIGYLYLTEGYLSVSGDYERYFEEDGVRYHHILDPKTGYPAQSGLRSAACFAPNGTAADALSTALFVMGSEKALDFHQSHAIPHEAILVTTDNEIILTDGLLGNGQFELTNENYTLRSKNPAEY